MTSPLIAFVPAALLDSLNIGEKGFTPDPTQYMYERMVDAVDFAPRNELEEDPSRKQIIPYVVVERADAVWTMVRTAHGNEHRLHHRASVGVGGHVERETSTQDIIRAGMEREMMEELVMDDVHLDAITYIGVLHDATTPVGKVHVGVVFRLRLPEDTVISIRETHKLYGMWCPSSTIQDATHQGNPLLFESWSALVLEHLYPGLDA